MKWLFPNMGKKLQCYIYFLFALSFCLSHWSHSLMPITNFDIFAQSRATRMGFKAIGVNACAASNTTVRAPSFLGGLPGWLCRRRGIWLATLLIYWTGVGKLWSSLRDSSEVWKFRMSLNWWMESGERLGLPATVICHCPKWWEALPAAVPTQAQRVRREPFLYSSCKRQKSS